MLLCSNPHADGIGYASIAPDFPTQLMRVGYFTRRY